MTHKLLSLSVEELAPQIKNGTVSPVELTEAVFHRAEESQGKINAYLSFYREEALEQAKKAEEEIKAGNYLGMYHGIPMAIKDNIYFKNKVSTMGSTIHKDFVSTFDATVVEKLREAGVIFTGKLNMHEYAMSITNANPYYGAVRNPWNTEKISGGSSGGSGAAVAVGSSLASVGTDTAGSIRIPAAACGVVGLKPTRGRVSAHGVYPLSWTQDHVGPITKTVKDAAGLLNILAGHDEKDPVSINQPAENYLEQITGDVKGLRIGINEDYFFNQIDTNIEKPVRDAIQALVDKGAEIMDISLPSFTDVQAANFTFSVSEASTVHMNSILERPEDFGEDIRGFLMSGAFPSTKEYAHAVQVREAVIKDFDAAFEKVDVILSPTLPVMPNKLGESTVDLNGELVDLLPNFIRLTGPANVAGIPTLSVPCGFNGKMPVGLQIMGANFKEAVVLNTGYAVEQSSGMKDKHPTL